RPAAVATGMVQLRSPVAVVADEEIEITISIVIEPGGARAPGRARSPGSPGYVAERAVSVVMKEVGAAVSGEVDVRMAVVVIIAHSDPHPVAVDPEPGALRDVLEGTVRPLVVERRIR